MNVAVLPSSKEPDCGLTVPPSAEEIVTSYITGSLVQEKSTNRSRRESRFIAEVLLNLKKSPQNLKEKYCHYVMNTLSQRLRFQIASYPLVPYQVLVSLPYNASTSG